MYPEMIKQDTTMNGSIKVTLSTGQTILNNINVVCHSISTNRPEPFWIHKSNYKPVCLPEGKYEVTITGTSGIQKG